VRPYLEIYQRIDSIARGLEAGVECANYNADVYMGWQDRFVQAKYNSLPDQTDPQKVYRKYFKLGFDMLSRWQKCDRQNSSGRHSRIDDPSAPYPSGITLLNMVGDFDWRKEMDEKSGDAFCDESYALELIDGVYSQFLSRQSNNQFMSDLLREVLEFSIDATNGTAVDATVEDLIGPEGIVMQQLRGLLTEKSIASKVQRVCLDTPGFVLNTAHDILAKIYSTGFGQSQPPAFLNDYERVYHDLRMLRNYHIVSGEISMAERARNTMDLLSQLLTEDLGLSLKSKMRTATKDLGRSLEVQTRAVNRVG